MQHMRVTWQTFMCMAMLVKFGKCSTITIMDMGLTFLFLVLCLHFHTLVFLCSLFLLLLVFE